MKFMLLVHTDREVEARFTEEERANHMEGHRMLARTLRETGKFVDGAGLLDDDAATVRIVGGQTIHSDGPYVETKEVVGGYYIVECDDLAEACRYASAVPTALYGTVEVRRLYE